MPTAGDSGHGILPGGGHERVLDARVKVGLRQDRLPVTLCALYVVVVDSTGGQQCTWRSALVVGVLGSALR
jgi:hypothetical protein